MCPGVINLGGGVGYMISEGQGSTKFCQGKVGGIFSIVLNIVVVDKFIFFLLHVFVSYLSVLTFCLLVLTLTLHAWKHSNHDCPEFYWTGWTSVCFPCGKCFAPYGLIGTFFDYVG